MNFYVDSGGVVLHVEPERIFQGSANANTIRFIGAFAPNLPVLVAFKLPNGVWTTPQSMGFSAQLSGVETKDGVQFNTWEYQIPQVVTENYGTVNVQFYVYGDAGGTGGQIASAMSSFVVEKGVPITLPDPMDDYQTLLTQILAVLSQIQSEIGDLPNNYVPKASGSNVAYINDQNGATATKPFAVDVTDNALVARSGNGQIRVPLAPLQGYDATSKKYVDESIEALPSKYVTLDTDQTIDGTKGFTSPITVGGQTWHTAYMKDSFVYTVDGNNYEVTYPEKSGLMALKSDIPTDYVTQGQLAQTNQNVEDLYTILEQAQVVTVTTLEQAYTTRETADGEDIVDGVQTTVKEIRGKTVATENLIPYPYTETTKTENGVTFTDNGDGSITVNGTATAQTVFSIGNLNIQNNSSYFLSGCPSTGSTLTYILYMSDRVNGYADAGAGRLIKAASSELLVSIIIYAGATLNGVIFRPMLNEGTEAKPYSKWFAGLKNASFEKIVNTGRNLIDPATIISGYISDADFTISGNKNIYRSIKCYLPAGKYTLQSSVAINIIRTMIDGNYLIVSIGNLTSYTFTTTQSGYVGISFRREDDTNWVDDTNIWLVFGDTATAYEPYISDTLSAATPIELTEYDVAFPEMGETKRQSNTLTFDGTEHFGTYSTTEYYIYTTSLYVYGFSALTGIANKGFRFIKPNTTNSKGCYIAGSHNDTFNFWFKVSDFPEFDTLDKFKSWVTAQYAAGNPLTVTYKTAEATTEATPFDKSKYIAWKNGSETIDQGSTDNSEYGAENTVKQDYFTLTGGTTNV